MDIKKTTPTNTITRTLSDFEDQTGNIYETLNVISRRANQISTEVKGELSRKLAEFAFTTDNLEETFENREQIEISRHYESMPKATLIAIDEYLDREIEFHHTHATGADSADSANSANSVEVVGRVERGAGADVAAATVTE